MPAPDLNRTNTAPETLLEWLESNILATGGLTNVLNPRGLHWLSIQAWQGVAGTDATGTAVDMFRLRNGATGAHDGIAAHVCNYRANACNSVSLDNSADFCFTVTLNGCSFGIGPQRPDGTVQVCHANNGGNTQNQRGQVQQVLGSDGAMAGVTMLEPAQYRHIDSAGGNHQATVFGIRSGMRWNFYFQSYTALGYQQYRLNGVFPIR